MLAVLPLSSAVLRSEWGRPAAHQAPRALFGCTRHRPTRLLRPAWGPSCVRNASSSSAVERQPAVLFSEWGRTAARATGSDRRLSSKAPQRVPYLAPWRLRLPAIKSNGLHACVSSGSKQDARQPLSIANACILYKAFVCVAVIIYRRRMGISETKITQLLH